MIDRTFNQEERSNLTQDKRMVLVDPGKNKSLVKSVMKYLYFVPKKLWKFHGDICLLKCLLLTLSSLLFVL